MVTSSILIWQVLDSYVSATAGEGADDPSLRQLGETVAAVDATAAEAMMASEEVRA